ncbi:MAG TPA: polysaccharide biosynthesis tyrosine autokinase [Terriglobia bacterium]|nr:polysaccharide biosynthesis tyrosine autokinase [Terriglobia bacterium]
MMIETKSVTNSVIDEVSRLCEERQTGVLLLTNSKGERINISFSEGFIDTASTNRGSRRLGDYLVRDGFVTSKDLDALQADAQRQKIVLGEAIVRKKLVGHGEVGAAVRRQTLEVLMHALEDEFKVSSFTNSLRAYFVPARITFPHVLLELSRRSTESFEPVRGLAIALNTDRDASDFSWNPEELSVLNALGSPRTFEALLSATMMSDLQLKRVLGILERVGAVNAVPESDARPNLPVARSESSLEIVVPEVTNAVFDEKLEVARNEFSFTSEQFKNLKIQLKQAESEAPLKVFTVSSPDAQDGKSLVSVNLAFAFAQDPGCKVLIIDCDLRKPSLDRYLGVTAEPGLLQYLAGGPMRPQCFMRRINNLHFMTAGGIAPNPIEALSMRKMKELVESLKTIFDTIILDAPPFSPIADARVVTALSDGLLMVIRSGKTAYSSTDRAFKAIDPRKLLGVVLNDVKPMPFQTYHSYSYYQYGENRLVYSGNGKGDSKRYLKS